MMHALHAEWTKLRTLPGTIWLLLSAIALTVGLSALVAAVVECPTIDCDPDPARVALTGVLLGQAVVAVLAVLVISAEYGTGMIRTTFGAMPRRSIVLAAKSTVVGAVVMGVGVLGVAGSVLTGRLIMPGNGFTAAHGRGPMSLGDDLTLRAALGSVIYLVLIALMSLGVAAIVRDSAAAIGTVLGLLFLFPVVTQVVSDPEWNRRLQRIAPMTAGLAIQATTDVDSLPIGPWAGLGVLAGWVVAALLGGALVLRVRDA